MNRCLCFALIAVLICVVSCTPETGEKNPVKKDTGHDHIVWNIDNLESIGGNPVTVLGSPNIIDTPQGKAVEFSGKQDGLIVDTHPLEGVDAFTLEIIFRPDAGGLPEQRFFHLQENEGSNRLLIETRLTEDDMWYLDTYMKSDETDQTLIDKTKTHPVGEWYNATLVFDGSEMRHYVNGVMELSADIASFTPPKQGKTSIGVRINKVHWFKGAIRKARFTKEALAPEEFLKP